MQPMAARLAEVSYDQMQRFITDSSWDWETTQLDLIRNVAEDVGSPDGLLALDDTAFVKAGTLVPPKSLVAGIPARVVRELSEQEMAWKTEGTVLYQHLARRSLATMIETEALSEIEPDRKRIDLPDIKPLIEAKADWAEAGPDRDE